jgi:ABC-type multidrug transport system fused ATPase/permease subunit
MKTIKNLLKKYFKHFSYFYSYLRYRMIVALVLSLVVGTLDGFGLAMFLPLLQMVEGNSNVSPETMGNLRFLVDFLAGVGISLNLTAVLLVILFFFMLKGVAKFIETWNKVIVSRYFVRRLRFDSIERLNNFSYKKFVMSNAGRIQNTLTGEINRVTGAYKNYFLAMQSIVMVSVYVVLAFLANPQFAFFVIVGGALSNLIYQSIYKKTKSASRQVTAMNHDFQSLIIQKVAFFKYLKATALIRPYSRKLKNTVLQIEEVTKRMGFYNAILSATREPLVVLVVIGVILVQVTLFSKSLGLIILSLLFFYRALTFLMFLQTNWNMFLTGSGSLDNMQDFMKELKQGQDKTGKVKMAKFESNLEMVDASFYYGQTLVLKNIKLSVKRNETLAVVGESGSGKTTLVNILAGLMPVDQGKFLIDGIDSQTLDINSYQQRIGYITQEPVIFSDSVFDNVTFWAEKNPENLARFWDALRRASIHDFVASLPLKEDSLLGNNGIMVSGGQKQRISIARELYKDLDILIMDEATSALDSETEKAIQENIDFLKGQYTILIVAHRLSTIKNADRVILMNDGKVEAIGSFESLKDSSKLFEKMVVMQEV